MINQVEVEKVYKTFGEVKAVDGVSLKVAQGHFFSLLGPSGCGKTTLLRLIAGFEIPNSGDILIDSKSMDRIAPNLRPTNMVFQNYAIFPHLNVEENVAYGLRKKRLSKDEKLEMINKSLELVGLSGLNNRSSNALSGGQKQRVALARSLVQRPQILMLDEPLSALDIDMQHKLQQYILCLHCEYELTTILISHDLAEIIKMSDYVLAIEQGRITKQGQPAEIFTNQRAINGGCEFVGKIIDINQQGVMFVLTILIGTDSVQVIADKDEIHQFRPGDTVFVGLTSFNPVLRKIDL